MGPFLGQILTLLTTPPGNLIYHIVLVFSIAGALLVAIQYLRASKYPQAWRTVFGLCIVLGLQLALFIIDGTVGQKLLTQQTVLPPFDRAVTLLTLIWIVWLWAFPEPMLPADAAALLLNLLVVMALGLTLLFRVQNSATVFNLSGFEVAWQGFSLVVVLFGILGLTLRRPSGWGNGLAMLILSFLGHFVSLIFRADGNFPGFVRLTQLAMFPLLLALSQRFPTSIRGRPFVAKPVQTGQPMRERRRYGTDLKTFHTLMSLAAENDAGKIGQTVTRGIAQAMLADLCFLITLGGDNSLAITCGYDLIREENLKGTNINRDAIPLLAAAIERGRPLHLPASSTSLDLKGLGQILGLPNPGHLLSVPVVSREHGPLGGILILSPYSNRLWNATDQTYLSDVSALFLSILERVQRTATLEVEREQSVQEAYGAVEQVTQIQRKYEQAAAEAESLREKNVQAQLQVENMGALLLSQEKAEETIEQLKTENEQLRNGSSMLGANNEQLERDLHQTLEEMEHVQSQLAEANTKILELEKHPAAPIPSKQVGDVVSISQGLRRPMSSVVGYTDLLLGESVGILGALQRKFLERIKASSERIGDLVDDLTQMAGPGIGVVKSKPELLDLNLIIDNAMAYTGLQIREKNITLRLDLAEIVSRLHADRDALQQILIHLLQNATAATRAEGSINLRVHLLSEDGRHFLSIQVTDSGGGIAPGDIPYVFARRYRAEHALIQGLGDTGVGLSIAKALTEAQDGRIWVETESGVGSTFSVLIPVVVESL